MISIEKIIPSDNYEDLKRQFNALKVLLASKEAQIQVYQKRIKEFSIERTVQLEAELESEKEMNTILTNELLLK